MEIADKVTAALQASIVPSVIARGGEIRVLGVEGGTVTLEVTGSPGAALPLMGRIETLIRRAVPEIVAVRLVGPVGPAAAGTNDVAALVQGVLDRDINPVIAAHRGRASVVSVEEGWVRLRLDGGCQGCSLAEVTVRQGIEPLLRARLPAMTGLIDVTDHAAGTEPFFSPEKR